MDNVSRLILNNTPQPPGGLAGEEENCAFCDETGRNLVSGKYCKCRFGEAKADDDSRFYEKLDEFEFD
jgi:hypothetical protein